MNGCGLVGQHRPAPLTIEQHHLIPVAWQQQTWQPATPPYPGVDPDGRGSLWDARTMPLCPTHHRNVHALIVTLMRQVALNRTEQIPSVRVAPAHRLELGIAVDALEHYQAAGGSLLFLTARREWGEA